MKIIKLIDYHYGRDIYINADYITSWIDNGSSVRIQLANGKDVLVDLITSKKLAELLHHEFGYNTHVAD